jgi:hypothetical protein
MNFIFVDGTGDICLNNTDYFGLALLQVHSDHYKAIRELVSQFRWLGHIFDEFKTKPPRKGGYSSSEHLIRGLASFAEYSYISATGLFIHKNYYGGRFLNWSELDIDKGEWPYYLRNYLLRHLLEYHFSNADVPKDDIDLVLDRVMLSEDQRKNTIQYLSSRAPIPLRRPFSIPRILHLTVADSEYTDGLQIAHLLADVVKKHAGEQLPEEYTQLRSFINIIGFIGHRDDKTIPKG